MMSHNSSIFFGGAGRSPASTVTGNNINGDSNEDHGGEGDDGNGLESKLQGLAAALRKDRDVAHRTHQLAAEKLHLKQEEAEAARKTLESTEAKLVERIGSVEKVQAEVHGLQREVDILNAKASFQHEELGTLKDQLARHESEFDHHRAQRKVCLDKLRSMVQLRRQQREQQNAGAGSCFLMQEQTVKVKQRLIRGMKNELETDPALEYHRWRSRQWVDLVAGRAFDVDGWTRGVQDENAQMGRAICGYHRTFSVVQSPVELAVIEKGAELATTGLTEQHDPANDGKGTAQEAMAIDPTAVEAMLVDTTVATDGIDVHIASQEPKKETDKNPPVVEEEAVVVVAAQTNVSD